MSHDTLITQLFFGLKLIIIMAWMSSASDSYGNSESLVKANSFRCSQELKDYLSGVLREKAYGSSTSWNVYKLKPSGMFKHHSLFFTPTSNPGDGFTAEIRVEDGQVIFFCMTFEGVPVAKFTHLGSIHMSVSNIINMAVDSAQEFGDYDGTLNNCQHYCNSLADKFGVSTEWTDVAVAGVLGALGAALVGAAIGGVLYARRGKK